MIDVSFLIGYALGLGTIVIPAIVGVLCGRILRQRRLDNTLFYDLETQTWKQKPTTR